MFCINCFHSRTTVTNSRASKKQPQVWRRRQCPKCETIFTTHERPSLSANTPVHLSNGTADVFNSGKLLLSIAKAFTHAPEEAQYNAMWLTQTVEMTLSTQQPHLTPEDIEAAVHQVLKQYDELAAMQYAAQHQLILSTKRRGRPSFRERERPSHESPSQ
jgi:transcriptional repressor NrdR